MNSIVIITESKDSHSTKLLDLNSKLCWPNVLITYHSDINMMKNSRQSIMSLTLPTASPQITRPWNGNASSPHGKHPQNTSISHFPSIFKCKIKPAASKFWIYNTYCLPFKICKNGCEMWNRNEICPTTLSMKSGHRFKLKVVLALHTRSDCRRSIERIR